MSLTGEKIRRIRGPFGPLSPASMFPQESARSRSDPLARKLGYLALAWAALMLLLYGGYCLGLEFGSVGDSEDRRAGVKRRST
jgi:hypothetical protein